MQVLLAETQIDGVNPIIRREAPPPISNDIRKIFSLRATKYLLNQMTTNTNHTIPIKYCIIAAFQNTCKLIKNPVSFSKKNDLPWPIIRDK